MKILTFGILLLAGTAAMLVNPSAAQQAPAAKPATKASPAKPEAAAPQLREEEEGERVFAANCSRCHTAPDGFSQRISGTVVQHMRVRASLSKEDEKALMRFFNPQ